MYGSTATTVGKLATWFQQQYMCTLVAVCCFSSSDAGSMRFYGLEWNIAHYTASMIRSTITILEPLLIRQSFADLSPKSRKVYAKRSRGISEPNIAM